MFVVFVFLCCVLRVVFFIVVTFNILGCVFRVVFFVVVVCFVFVVIKGMI